MTIEEYYKTKINKKGNKKKFISLMMCLSLIIFSLYTILNWCDDNSKIRQINTEIDKNIKLKTNQNQEELVNSPLNLNSDFYYYATFPFFNVDFSYFLSKNSDTVGFLQVKNTNIHYPVVKTVDNNYYLEHSFDKSENKAGWIYMDYRSNIDSLVDNTVIYGHSRLDGTMFGTLKYALTSDWQADKDNYVIYLSTLKENMIFQIFSIYSITRENYYLMPNFSSGEKKQVWLNTMRERNIAPINTEVNVNDKILTLSTCQNSHGGRIVIHSKLIKKQQN